MTDLDLITAILEFVSNVMNLVAARVEEPESASVIRENRLAARFLKYFESKPLSITLPSRARGQGSACGPPHPR